MIYLPDTNAFSRYFRGDDSALVSRFIKERPNVRLSSIVLAELEYGATKSRVPLHRTRLDGLLLSIDVEPWTAQDAAEYGRVRADLERRGVAAGGHDMQIAAQAIRLGAACVTHNTGHFSNVSGLKLQDWQTLP
ncbi:MAG: PIN domain-containing protein [Opitutaceae bacterium]